MAFMFHRHHDYNHPLNTWNVEKVTNMKGIFSYASAFNQPIDRWNICNVKDMSEMFYDAYSFNQPLDSWNLPDISRLFCVASCDQEHNDEESMFEDIDE